MRAFLYTFAALLLGGSLWLAFVGAPQAQPAWGLDAGGSYVILCATAALGIINAAVFFVTAAAMGKVR